MREQIIFASTRPMFQGQEQQQASSALQGQEQQLQRRDMLQPVALLLFLIIKHTRRESQLSTNR